MDLFTKSRKNVKKKINKIKKIKLLLIGYTVFIIISLKNLMSTCD